MGQNQKFKIASLFAGCGGLDLGFKKAGFDIVWANDFDKSVWETHKKNFKNTRLDTRSIIDIKSKEIPGNIHGIIGGPPCQSWSLAGAMRGVNDHRGQVFYEYIRMLKDKKPLFFLAENVPGLISKTHFPEFIKLLSKFEKIGYDVDWTTLNAKDFGVAQERQRVFILGYKKSIGLKIEFPKPTHGIPDPLFSKSKKFSLEPYVALKNLIGNMPKAIPAKEKNKPNVNGELLMPNHEYMIGCFSTIFMSRNRKKEWDDVSYTIQAGGRHAPLYPAASKMIKVEKDLWKFDDKTKHPYRRLSIRECARIQSFPDNFIFYYDSIADGYKMVGNAVPVLLAKTIALKIKAGLKKATPQAKKG
tara:strand:+ start:33 stop:1109 length:1077 start_codon:yes stop_codon:yes gene_type:complete